MLESHRSLPVPHEVPPPGIADFAKWPPDDDDVPDPPGGGVPAGGGGSMMGPGDGDFKKGRVGPVAIIVTLLVLIGGGAFFLLGVKQSVEELTVEQAAERRKAILILPKDEQVPKWRELASPESAIGGQGGNELKREALKQLAYHQDGEAMNLLVKALENTDVTIRAQAATAIAWMGLPAGEAAKGALLKLMKESDKGEKPQVAWALVELGDATAFEEVMALYRLGHLSKVQRLDGVVAFDPEKLVKLITLDQLAAMAGDESSAVRQLVATVLSRNAEPKWTDALIKLVQDTDEEVARQAAPGLGKIGDDRARGPLLAALDKASKEEREKYLHAIRDGIGAQGLVLALDGANKVAEEKPRWYRTKEIFELIRTLADPRGADYLVKYIESEPHIHWQTEAAFALAEVGDVRAVPTLAKRLRMDPLKIYSDKFDWEQMLKRDDKERVVAARMLADVAFLHPDKAEQIRKDAEFAVSFWINELPSPHANGLRALARMKTTDGKILKQLRDWSDPKEKLPVEGQQPPMPEEWVVAQSALRYVGMLKDEQSISTLEKQMKRRPADIDATMDSLMGGGLAIIGMTLRALGKGSCEGFAELREQKAFKQMFEYIQDDKENEQGRETCCQSLAWVATDEDMKSVVEEVAKLKGTEKMVQFRRACFLESLITRPVPAIATELIGLINADAALETRHQAARALGKAGLSKEIESQLFEKMKDDVLMVDAALALVLGGAPDTAARAVAMFGDPSKKPALDELQDLWYRSFGYWSHEDLAEGHIFRWVDNAVAISRLELNQTPQEWARVLLIKQFDNLHFDNGPHSFTRVVLRARLGEIAKSDDAAKRGGAIRTLKFMGERGMLQALRDAPGETGKIAAEAYHELMNPKIVTSGVIQVAEPKKDDVPGE